MGSVVRYIDVEEVTKALGGHSIYSPSSSAGWTGCSAYIFANMNKKDSAGEDAAYGTVGHEVGEEWLGRIKRLLDGEPARTSRYLRKVIDKAEPLDLIGEIRTVENKERSFEIEIDEEMISYVREYVEWCAELEGEHYIETRVDFSHITPIPKQGGTADHAACMPGRLVITDLKMGRGVQVFAKDNTQALLYAIGFFREYDWQYDFDVIEIRIAQPRREHFDTWTITREELLEWEAWLKVKAYEAWNPNAPRTPGPKQCQWCKDTECAALAAWLHQEEDDCFDDVSGECKVCGGFGCDACEVIDGDFRVIEPKSMEMAKTALDKGWEPDPKDPSKLSTAQLAKLLRMRKVIEKWFSAIEAELEGRALDGEEIPHFKLVKGRAGKRKFNSKEDAEAFAREHGIDPMLSLYKIEMLTPAQFEEVARRELGLSKKKVGELLKAVTTQAVSRDTLAPVTDDRETRDNLVDVFDAVEDDDL